MPEATHQQAPSTQPPQIDFLANVRQFDEPLLYLAPWADSCPPYQIWRNWLAGALVGGRQLSLSLRESAVNAYWASVNNSTLPSPPCMPYAVLADIDRNLLSIQAKEFLLTTNAGVFLYVDFERRAKVARGRP